MERERNAYAAAVEERRRLMAEVAKIDAAGWSHAQRALWAKKIAGASGSFDCQPWPQPSPPPRNLSRKVIENALAEPTRKNEAALRAWADTEPPPKSVERVGNRSSFA